MLKYYYRLTKPGIIYGNLVTVVGGFFLATHHGYHETDLVLLFATLLGISLIIAGSCVINNIIDRDIDALMERTKHRELVLGVIALRHAYIYAATLTALGILSLYFYTNTLTLFAALIGVFFYVVCYSLYAKRRSVLGTLVGSVSGAMPPVVGYLAVAGSVDTGAILLFLILSVWQMPHSYAIAVYRLDDYRKAKIPVLPVARGMMRTKIETLIYTLLFLVLTHLLYFTGYAGKPYLLIMSIATVLWVLFSAYGFFQYDDRTWAKRMFAASILIVTIFSAAIAIQ